MRIPLAATGLCLLLMMILFDIKLMQAIAEIHIMYIIACSIILLIGVAVTIGYFIELVIDWKESDKIGRVGQGVPKPPDSDSFMMGYDMGYEKGYRLGVEEAFRKLTDSSNKAWLN